jgi:chromosome segregation ATPase
MEIGNLSNQLRRAGIEAENASSKISALEQNKQDCEHKLKVLSEENGHLLKELSAKKQAIGENEQAMRRLSDEISTHKENVRQLDSTIAQQSGQLLSLREGTVALEKKATVLESVIDQRNAAVKELQVEITNQQIEEGKKQQTIEDQDEQLQKLGQIYVDQQNQSKKLASELDQSV